MIRSTGFWGSQLNGVTLNLFLPHYTISSTDMYKKLVVHSIRAPRSLDILTDAIHKGLGDSMKFSWRPDWIRAVPPYIVSRQGHTLRYSTSTSKLTDAQHHTVDAFLLDVRGYQVDTVAWKSTLMPFLEDDASWDGPSDSPAADGGTGGYSPC